MIAGKMPAEAGWKPAPLQVGGILFRSSNSNRGPFPMTKNFQLSTFNLQLFLALLLLATASARAADAVPAFDQANKLYEEGKFSAAAEAYAKIIPAGNRSPAVLFNQGNAHFQAGQIGRAIAAYRSAGVMTPRDPDLRANLDFARQRVTGPTLRPAALRRWTDSLTTNEWTLLAIAPVWLWFALMIAGQVRPAFKPHLRNPLIVSGVAALIACGALGWILNARYNEQFVVVTARESVARFGPLAESQSAFTAADGADLLLLDAKDDWVQVSDGARNSGWVKTNGVERVR